MIKSRGHPKRKRRKVNDSSPSTIIESQNEESAFATPKASVYESSQLSNANFGFDSMKQSKFFAALK